MNPKKTFILGLILLGALLYIWLVEIPKDEAKASRDVVFNGVAKDQIESIQISKNGSIFTLKNAGSQESNTAKPEKKDQPNIDIDLGDNLDATSWEMEGIKGFDFETATFNTLLTSLTAFKSGTALYSKDLEADLSSYGLKEPELSVKVNTKKGTYEISFGKLNELLRQRYARITGFVAPADESGEKPSDVFLVSQELYNAANKNKLDFRSKTPLNFNDAQLKSFSIKGKAQNIKFELGEDFSWRIVEPGKFRASSELVSETLRELKNTKAEEFFDGESINLADYHLDAPEMTVNLEYKDEKKAPLEAKISKLSKTNSKTDKQNPQEKYYLVITGKPSVFRISTNPAPKILKSVDDYRDRQFFKFSLDQVNKVTFTQADNKNQIIAKSGDEWLVNDKAGDAVFVNQLLRELSDLKAESFVTQSLDFGFDKPKLKVTLDLGSDTTNKTQKTLFIGNTNKDKNYFASFDDLNETYLISETSLTKITPKEEVLLKQPTPEPTKAP